MTKEEFTEEVLILRIGRLKEIDCWVRFLSPSRGILNAFAFGGCKSRRRFPGCLDILNQVLFKVVSNPPKKYLSLAEGTLVQRFTGITRDLSRLGMAINCVKFLEAAHGGENDSKTIYHLILSTLEILNSEEYVPAALPLFFRAKTAVEHGYCPDFHRCSLCGYPVDPSSDENYFFVLSQCRIYCSKCYQSLPCTGTRLGTSSLLGLQSIFTAPPSCWTNKSVYTKLDRTAMQIVDKFVQYHLGLIWQTGHFRSV